MMSRELESMKKTWTTAIDQVHQAVAAITKPMTPGAHSHADRERELRDLETLDSQLTGASNKLDMSFGSYVKQLDIKSRRE